MPKVDLDYRDYFRPIAEALRAEGMLLIAVGADGRPNAMTIGWAGVGPIWGRPLFMAMVRPSRYTYGLIEQSGDFTVHILPAGMEKVASYCGHNSGRDHDKFAAQGLKVVPSRKVKSPSIAEAVLTLECRVLDKTDLNAETLDPAIHKRHYAEGNYHRLYFGEIVAAYGEPERLPAR